jgi:hypothetical protein
MRIRTFVTAVLAVFGWSSLAKAQRSSVQDSASVHHIGAAVFREAYYRIARAALADSGSVVSLSLPAGDFWAQVERHLLTSLRARRSLPSDRTMQVVNISDVRNAGDTLIARFYLGDRWRCADGRWKGSGTEFEARAVRRGDAWMPVTTKPVGYGDSAACRSPDA